MNGNTWQRNIKFKKTLTLNGALYTESYVSNVRLIVGAVVQFKNSDISVVYKGEEDLLEKNSWRKNIQFSLMNSF